MSVGAVNKNTGDRIPTAGMPAIDNALDLTSSNPVQNAVITAALANKQDKTDNALQTTDKTVVGAVNELKSGLTNVESKIDDATVYPYADVITIEDAVPANLADCSVKIEPVQDLHGYDKPWVGGAGKNKLPLVLADIKAANTDGTWNDNVYTINSGTITVNTDDGGNVTSIKVNGTFSATTVITLWKKVGAPYPFENTTYTLNGCSNGSSSTYKLDVVYNVGGNTNVLAVSMIGQASADFSVISNVDAMQSRIVIYAGTLTNQMFYPMLRLSTETDATFAPYTNVCPISGHTEASVEVTDGDETTKTYTIALGDTIYGGKVRIDSNGNIVMDVDSVKFTPTSTTDIGKNTAEWPTNQFIVYPSESAKANGYIISDRFKTIAGVSDVGVFVSSSGRIRVNTENSYQSASDALAGEFASSEFCYELATPTTIQLTPQQIQLLKGTNTLTASTGQISVTVNGVSGSIGAVQEQVNATDAALAELAADIAEQLPTAPTTDGTYTLTVTVTDGEPSYSWVSGS